MSEMSAVAAILVAGGRGARLGGDPKQFRLLAGVPVLRRAAEALRRSPALGPIVVVVPDEHRDRAAALLAELDTVTLVSGGDTRRGSVVAGLQALPEVEVVLVHDAARPDLPGDVIDRLLAALGGAEAASPVLPVVDTMAVATGGWMGDVVDRSHLMRVQTPQAFRAATLRRAHAEWTGEEPTDDAQMVRALGVRVATVPGDARLAKITWPADLVTMGRRLGERVSVTGAGFDVHRLELNEDLWLCGVKLEHTHGLSGHSDADVGLHSLTDAILGAIGAGDIGDHFPPSDERWRGASSDRFLAHAAALARSAGARLEHLDVTLICELPKIGPHKAAMRDRIATIVDLPSERISVKATTTEALGFAGRREGIAAQATASVSVWREASA